MDPRVQRKIDEIKEKAKKQKRENPDKKSEGPVIQTEPTNLTRGLRNERESAAFMAELNALINNNPHPF